MAAELQRWGSKRRQTTWPRKEEIGRRRWSKDGRGKKRRGAGQRPKGKDDDGDVCRERGARSEAEIVNFEKETKEEFIKYLEQFIKDANSKGDKSAEEEKLLKEILKERPKGQSGTLGTKSDPSEGIQVLKMKEQKVDEKAEDKFGCVGTKSEPKSEVTVKREAKSEIMMAKEAKSEAKSEITVKRDTVFKEAKSEAKEQKVYEKAEEIFDRSQGPKVEEKVERVAVGKKRRLPNIAREKIADKTKEKEEEDEGHMYRERRARSKTCEDGGRRESLGGKGCYERSIKDNSLGGVKEERKVRGDGQSGSYPSLTMTKWNVSKSGWMVKNQMLVKYAGKSKRDGWGGQGRRRLQDAAESHRKAAIMSSPKSPKRS